MYAEYKYDTYAPTPFEHLNIILNESGLQPGERFCDLGSGDGRFVIEAAHLGADATGIELDNDLYVDSANKIMGLGLSDHARILRTDFYDVDLSEFDVIFINVSEDADRVILEHFKQSHKAGARLILYMGALGARRCHDCTSILYEEDIEGATVIKFDMREEDGQVWTHVVMIVQYRDML